MSITGVLIATAVVAVTGLVIGILLGFAGDAFAVKVDEREEQVREALPGYNCGGCGYAGCDALAAAIVSGERPVGACPVGGSPVAEKVAAIMGVRSETSEKMVAFVQCAGTCDKTRKKYEYHGIADCKKLAVLPGRGEKICVYGCMGYGSCVTACRFDAIHVRDGVAFVDKETCTACSQCVLACPNHLIELVPYESSQHVACHSIESGKEVKKGCDAGCIGCRRCEKICPEEAITVNENLAHVDYTRCTGCGKCQQVCPVHVIR